MPSSDFLVFPFESTALARNLDWSGLQTALLFCYRDKVYDPYRRGNHTSPDMAAWLVQRGSAFLETPDGRLTARTGEWLIPRPRSGFPREFSRDALIISVHFQARWADGRNIFEEGLPITIPSGDAPDLERKAHHLLRFVRKNFGLVKSQLVLAETTLSVHLNLHSLFMQWLGAFIEAMTAAGLTHTRFGDFDERIRRALFWIDRLPLDRPFPKAGLAGFLDLGASQLDRLFVRETGATPQRYFESRRLDHARLALSQKTLLIKQVAYSLGFQSASHFSTWFKRADGKSPADFRLQAQLFDNRS